MSDPSCTHFSPKCGIEQSYYAYVPSLVANVVFVAIFGAALSVHLAQGIWFGRAWLGFTIAMVVGNASEVIGYIGRIMNHDNPFDQNGFLIQICCITIAPAFFSAGVYFCLGTITRICDPSISRIPPRFYAYIFIPCDLVSLILQAIGGAMASIATEERKSPDTGDNIMIAGVSFQVFTLSIFMILSVDYALRVKKAKRVNEVQREIMRMSSGKFLQKMVRWNKRLGLERFNKIDTSIVESKGVNRDCWTKRERILFRAFIVALAVSTLAIFTRCVYRVIEMSYGWAGPVIANEKLFIGFEGVCISVGVLVLNLFHPGFCLIKPGVHRHAMLPSHSRQTSRTVYVSTDTIDTVGEAKTHYGALTQRWAKVKPTHNNPRHSRSPLRASSGLWEPATPEAAETADHSPYGGDGLEQEKEEWDEETMRAPVSLVDILGESRIGTKNQTASAEGWYGQNIRDSIKRDDSSSYRGREVERTSGSPQRGWWTGAPTGSSGSSGVVIKKKGKDGKGRETVRLVRGSDDLERSSAWGRELRDSMDSVGTSGDMGDPGSKDDENSSYKTAPSRATRGY